MAAMSEKKHILITGGAGYIGSLLASELLRAGNYVTVVDNLLYGVRACWLSGPSGFPLYQGRCDRAGFRSTGVEPRLAETGCRGTPGRDCWVPSLSGDRKAGCLAAQRRGGKACLRAGSGPGSTRFVFASTYSTYGPLRTRIH